MTKHAKEIGGPQLDYSNLRGALAQQPQPQPQPQKLDTGKLRLELIPPEFLEATARGLGFGAKKYSAGNWATGAGFDHSRLYGALQRHLTAYWSGQDIDAESGNCHLDHAACMLAFLIAHRERGLGNDDRVTVGAARAPKPRV